MYLETFLPSIIPMSFLSEVFGSSKLQVYVIAAVFFLRSSPDEVHTTRLTSCSQFWHKSNGLFDLLCWTFGQVGEVRGAASAPPEAHGIWSMDSLTRLGN